MASVNTVRKFVIESLKSVVERIQTLLSGKQDTLVSGTNIKTVNSTSLLGSGDITTPDTKNTAGSTNNTNQLYLIGATTQSANPQTYSNSTLYVDASQMLVAKNERVTDKNIYLGTGTGAQGHIQYDDTNKCIKFVFD